MSKREEQEKTVDIEEIADRKGEIMSEITLGDKTYPIHIGFGFLRTVERLYQGQPMAANGSSLGALYVDLANNNALGVLNFILAATCTLDSPPTEKQVEEAYADLDINQLCLNFTKLLEQSTMTQPQIKQYEKLGRMMAGLN